MNKVITCLVCTGFSLLSACNTQKETPPPPPVPVNLYTVKAEQVQYYDRYPSTTQALSQVNLLPQVSGAVTAILFKEGTHVKKGQKLYEIDRRIYENNYHVAVANLKVQQGILTQAQQDADRYIYLNSEKAVAKQLYDHAMITLQNAKNQVQSADESVKTAKTNMNYTSVVAPFDGTIGFSMVKLGDVVTPGTTVLNTVSTNDPIAADFVINEKQLPYFEDLLAHKGKTIDSLFTLQLPNNALYPANGQISVIDRAVDAQTGAIRIRLVFPNPKDFLRAGMSCVVRVHNQDTLPQIVVPGKAVTEQMGEYFVFVAKDTAVASGDTTKHNAGPVKGLYAFQKKVHTGATVGANVIIKDGLKQGDRIVLDGVQSLHDGSAITTANKMGPDQGKKGR